MLICSGNPKRVNSDERTRAILERRDKEERIRITQINAALKQGREEGHEEGRDEERVSVVMNMLGEGLDISLISKMTGLSIGEIKTLSEASRLASAKKAR